MRGTDTIVRMDSQISRDPLLSLEQFAIGGHASVRGYRENQIVRDSGAVVSAEARLPLFQSASGQPLLRVRTVCRSRHRLESDTRHASSEIPG